MNKVNWENPYEDTRGFWLKGNLHTHTMEGSSCGAIPFQDVVTLYKKAGYDFLSLSDHLKVVTQEVDSLILIPGVEWNARPEPFSGDAVVPEKHVGIYSPNREALEAYIRERTVFGLMSALYGAFQDDGNQDLTILNHPNWGTCAHWSAEEIGTLAGRVDGMEIYNGVIHRLEGSPFAVDKWDQVLSRGLKLLGFASDDFHQPLDFRKGWIMVKTPERTPEAVLGALKRGSFYCSTGVVFSEIHRTADVVTVATEEPAVILGIGRFGKVLFETQGHEASFPIKNGNGEYLRIEAMGEGSATAWTQPFFRSI